jgi:cytochrome o ubiquinol oxidase subunit II
MRWDGRMKRKGYFAFIVFSPLYAAAFLGGCTQMVLFDPKGPIGEAERFLIVAAFVLMLIVVVPVFVMAFWFARKYRASNTKATYKPKWSHSTQIELVMWLVPVAIVTALGILAWSGTHRLDPYKPIDPDVTPISIEVVSLDWKWLFIYPDHNIAAVNQLAFPAHVPLSLRITSDTVMTSFFIPQLGSQIYAMAGMQTRLHLMADEPGAYAGQNQQFSGRGYSDMNFKAIAASREEFEAWVQKAKQSPEKLDIARFDELRAPSVGNPVAYFSTVTPGLFDRIIGERMSNGMNPSPMGRRSGSMQTKTGASEGR